MGSHPEIEYVTALQINYITHGHRIIRYVRKLSPKHHLKLA